MTGVSSGAAGVVASLHAESDMISARTAVNNNIFLNIDKSYAYSVADKLGHVLALKLDHDAGLMVLHCF